MSPYRTGFQQNCPTTDLNTLWHATNFPCLYYQPRPAKNALPATFWVTLYKKLKHVSPSFSQQGSISNAIIA